MLHTVINKSYRENGFDMMKNIAFEVSNDDFDNKEINSFYQKINGFCEVISDSQINYKNILVPEIKYGYSKTYNTYYMLLTDNTIITFGKDIDFMFIFIVNNYLVRRYNQYEKIIYINFKELFRQRFPNIDYNPNVFRTEYIINCWNTYYKHKRKKKSEIDSIIKVYCEQLIKTSSVNCDCSIDPVFPAYDCFDENNNIYGKTYDFIWDEASSKLRLVETSLYNSDFDYNRRLESDVRNKNSKLLNGQLNSLEAYHYASYYVDPKQLNYCDNNPKRGM